MTGRTLNTDTAVAADAERATDMTEKITREEIQKWSYGCAGKSHGVHINSKVLAALCDLALQALDMQPSNADDLRAGSRRMRSGLNWMRVPFPHHRRKTDG